MCFNFSSDITFTNQTGTYPSSVIRGDVFLPPKSVNGCKSGAWAVASYLEAIHNKRYSVGSIGSVDTLYDEAKKLNQEQSDEIDEDYPTFQNLMERANVNSGLNRSVKYFNTINSLKMNIHKYGVAIIETYLTNMMLTDTLKQNYVISTSSNDEIIYNDYTKLFIVVGYNTSGIIAMNTLGRCWGSNGYAMINWDYLTQKLSSPNGDDKQVFIKGAVLLNCYG